MSTDTNVATPPATPEGTNTVTPPVESPNENWQNDTSLDDNGNPIVADVPADVPNDVPADTGDTPTDVPADTDATPNIQSELATTSTELTGFFKDAGLDLKDVAKQVTTDGTLSIDAFKKLVDKHGESVAGLIKDKVMNMHEKSQALVKSRDEAVFTQVQDAFKDTTDQDGKTTWSELSTWAKTAIPKGERAEINALLKQGGIATKLAVSSLINQFKQSDSFVQVEQLEQADGLSDDYKGGSLDKAGYDRELRKLLDAGHDYATSPEIATLDNRRMKTLRRGG